MIWEVLGTTLILSVVVLILGEWVSTRPGDGYGTAPPWDVPPPPDGWLRTETARKPEPSTDINRTPPPSEEPAP